MLSPEEIDEAVRVSLLGSLVFVSLLAIICVVWIRNKNYILDVSHLNTQANALLSPYSEKVVQKIKGNNKST